MRDFKIILTFLSIYCLLFATIVAHLIFDLNVQYVWMFCWQIDRFTTFCLTILLLAIAYLLQLLLSIFSTKHLRNWILWLHLLSGLILLAGIILLGFVLNSDTLNDRLVVFDSMILLIIAAWSIELYIQLRLNQKGAG
jgi:hypothetical protein